MTPTQVLSCEVCETFNNTYFEEHPHPACDVVATSHLGVIYVEMSQTMLRRHHDVTTGT